MEEKELRYGTDNKNGYSCVCDEQPVPMLQNGLSHIEHVIAINISDGA